jgi:hypothetical protein
MTRRKPLPYAATWMVDQSIMADTEALRALKPIVSDERMTNLEMLRRVGMAIGEIHEAIDYLREIKGDDR